MLHPTVRQLYISCRIDPFSPRLACGDEVRSALLCTVSEGLFVALHLPHERSMPSQLLLTDCVGAGKILDLFGM